VLATRRGQAIDTVGRWTARAAELGRVPPRHLAVLLSAYAAVLHNWVLPEHYLEWWGYGLYFLIATAAQAFCAGLLLFWPGRWVFLVGILGNSAILLLYAFTRTVGIPFFGPAAWQVERVGVLDLATAAAEVGLVVVLIRLMRQGPLTGRADPVPPAIPHDRGERYATLDDVQTKRIEAGRARRGLVATAYRTPGPEPGR
jgi:hypothetical protein